MDKTEHRNRRRTPVVVRNDVTALYAVYSAVECNCPNCDQYAHWQATGSVRTVAYLRTLGYDPDKAISTVEATKMGIVP